MVYSAGPGKPAGTLVGRVSLQKIPDYGQGPLRS